MRLISWTLQSGSEQFIILLNVPLYTFNLYVLSRLTPKSFEFPKLF